MSYYGWGNNNFSLMESTDGLITRLSSTTPVVPTALWHFDGDLAPAVGGGTFSILTGTPKYTNFAANMRGVLIDKECALELPAYVASLTITGDLTVVFLTRLSRLRTDDLLVKGDTFLSYTGPGETLANNALYEARTYRAGSYYFHEYGVGVNLGVPILGRLSLGDICVFAFRRLSNVITIWVNGVQISDASATLTAPAGGTSARLRLGTNVTDTSPSDFECAGLAIYNSALSSANLLSQATTVLGGRRHV